MNLSIGKTWCFDLQLNENPLINNYNIKNTMNSDWDDDD